MINIIYDEIDLLLKNGPDQELVENAKVSWLKNHQDGLEHNGYCYYNLSEFYKYGIDRYTDYEKTVNQITTESIHKKAKEVFGQGNMIRIVMRPE